MVRRRCGVLVLVLVREALVQLIVIELGACPPPDRQHLNSLHNSFTLQHSILLAPTATMAILTHLLTLLFATPLLHAAILPSQNPLPPPNPSSSSNNDDETPLPLIIWHGLGDNYAADGLADVASLAEKIHPGTFTYIIRLDEDASSDRTATFFGNLTLQIDQVCSDLASHPILSTAPAVDALGFSQGGQFLRGYVERCNNPPVRSLVTFGS